MNLFTILILILFCLLVAAALLIWRGNNRLTVTELEVKSPQITEPVRIMHLSDLHNKQFGDVNCDLHRVVLEEKPDLVVITGDLEDRRQNYNPETAAFLTGLAQKTPVFFVYGNQEMRGNFKEKLTEELRKGGVTVLDDQTLKLTINGQPLSIFGINDYRCERRKNKVTNLSKKLLGEFCRDPGFKLLLTHYPQFFAYYKRNYHYSDYPIDLVLAGHAHGGLVRFPFLKGIIAPDQGFFPKYTAGIYEQNGVKMIVSRGLGNSGWPFRIGNPPEIVLITLMPE